MLYTPAGELASMLRGQDVRLKPGQVGYTCAIRKCAHNEFQGGGEFECRQFSGNKQACNTGRLWQWEGQQWLQFSPKLKV